MDAGSSRSGQEVSLPPCTDLTSSVLTMMSSAGMLAGPGRSSGPSCFGVWGYASRLLTVPASEPDPPSFVTLVELSSGRLHGLAASSVLHHRTG